jgi:RimJ/RimL family protein N-acetyltransferase
LNLTSIPHPTVLEGGLIRLVPLEQEHIEPLMRISTAAPHEFTFTSTPVNAEQAATYFSTAFSEREAGRAYPFAVLLEGTGEIVGSTRFADIRWQHRNAELGYTWFRPDMHRTGINVESKLLMLVLAFETVGLNRVQIHTDARNVRSQRAIEALGALREGILRRHMVGKDGFVRDTVVYSIVDREWAAVKRHLQARIDTHGVASR